jgi:hypothetical protein
MHVTDPYVVSVTMGPFRVRVYADCSIRFSYNPPITDELAHEYETALRKKLKAEMTDEEMRDAIIETAVELGWITPQPME